MENLSEIKKSEIRRCAQKLCELLKPYPNDSMLNRVRIAIDTMILNNSNFMNIEATPPVIENEDQA